MNLSKPQELIYSMEKYAGGAVSVICSSMLVNGKRDISAIKEAVNEIYRLNEALRIRINESDETVSQTVTGYSERDIDVLCFENKTELDGYAENYATVPLDLYGNLCEMSIVLLPDRYGVLIKIHHIVGDAWTLALLGTQFRKLMNGEAVEAYPYTDYIEAEKEYIQSKRYEKDRSYFLEQFKKCDEVTYISEKQSDNKSANRKTFIIDKTEATAIKGHANQLNSSAFMLFTAVLSTYINRTKMNAESFYIGTAVLNRFGVKEKNTAGMFVNTAPILIELDNNKSFADNLSSIESTTFSVFRHQKYNYGDVLASIRQEYGFTDRLYDVMISYQNAKVAGEDIKTAWYHSGVQNESLQVHIDDHDDEGIYRVHYDYQTAKFTEKEIDNLHRQICNLLFDAIACPEKKLYELNILTDDERQKLLFTFNDTAADYPKECVHRLFEKQAVKTPKKAAVTAADKTLTYEELNEEANKIANALIEKGIGVGDIVAFMLPRKSFLIAAMLGILKAGAAYMPVDPDYPQSRIDYMLSDSGAKYLITENNIKDLLNNGNTANPRIQVTAEDLCYYIYTSGSTGKPKSAGILHKNLTNLLFDNAKYFKNSKNVAFLTTISFDVASQEIFCTLVYGLSGYLFENKNSLSVPEFCERIADYKIDVLFATPTYFDMLTQTREYADVILKQIKLVLLAGEVFYLNDSVRNSDCKNTVFINQYGPAETHVATCYAVKPDAEYPPDSDIHIGKPIANTQIYIVDKYMSPTPTGITGELCIAGDCVGAGYLNRPELTAEKFTDNPFGKGKLYKTGDLAYRREDGNIVYVGRNDFQIKIRGLRIELGEIENAIGNMEGILQTVAAVRKNSEGRQLICAFYTGEEKTAEEIKDFIGEKLPKYMLPHIFKHIDKMPLTSSGKINRNALPKINLENITSDTDCVPPENARQRVLCRLVEIVLGTKPVGITDNFFDSGGDSLKAIEFVSKAHGEGIRFSLQNVFDCPTVKALSKCIEESDRLTISFADIEFTQINKILSKNKIEHITAPKECKVGNILLAGATGYLGVHILADFLDNDGGRAYCLVRSKDRTDGIKRMRELLEFHFGQKYADMKRIEVISADLQKDLFGLTDNEYKKLADNIDTVINCAASVKHYGTYKYFYDVNVETTIRLIDFCKKAGAKLIHASTAGVSGNSFADEFNSPVSKGELDFCEDNLYIGQPLDNVYVRSKFEAEKAVLDAMVQGLNANIMRMGQLTNRYSDGQFQKNYESNAFVKRISAILELGIVPDYMAGFHVEFTPIDEAAKAVMKITRHFNTEQTVFHINSTEVVCMEKLSGIFTELGFKLKAVSGAEFARALNESANREETEHIFEAFVNDIDENDRLNYGSNIRIKNDFTVRYLIQLGFEWPEIDFEYLKKYVEYFKRVGLIK